MGFKFSLESLSKDKKESMEKARVRSLMRELEKYPVSNNCQKYTAAFELLCRGKRVDVTASSTPFDRVFDIPKGCRRPIENWCLNRSATFTKLPTNNPLEFVNEKMCGYGKSARGFMGVTWAGSRAGHIFNICVIDGMCHICDSMTGRLEPIATSKFLIDRIDTKKSIGFFRSDSMTIDSELLTDTFDTKTKIYDIDDREKPRYASVLDLLQFNGKLGQSVTVYKDCAKYGVVHCDSIERDWNKSYDKWGIEWIYSWR